MTRLLSDAKTAEHLEDLASRLDAGLRPTDGGGPETLTATLRRELNLREYEWSALAAGETAGALPRVLRRLAAARQERAALTRQLTGVLAYPMFVLCLCGMVAALAIGMGKAPRGWFWLSGTLVLVIGVTAVWVTRRLRDPACDGDRLPVIGRLSRCAAEIPYLVALQVLYGAGVPVRAAHPQAAAAARVPWVRARLFVANRALEAGEPLAAALERQSALTTESLTLVRDGEITGQLEDALSRAIGRRREEYSRLLRRGASLVGALGYAYAAGSVLWLALSFYGAYFARLR